jgi:hypothetical protein
MTEKDSLIAEQPQDNMRPKSAAKYLDVSEPTLARWRQPHNQDIGPPFIRAKSGGCVIYRLKDLDAWLEQHRVESKDCSGETAK